MMAPEVWIRLHVVVATSDLIALGARDEFFVDFARVFVVVVLSENSASKRNHF